MPYFGFPGALGIIKVGLLIAAESSWSSSFGGWGTTGVGTGFHPTVSDFLVLVLVHCY
jgi:hypothetical protein